MDIMTGIPGGIPSKIAHAQEKAESASKKEASDSNLLPMSVFYGGNTGTCEGFAQDLETKASDYGFAATIQSLDDATENFPINQPVVIITASYEGKPPDNAKNFVSWLEQLKGQDKLKNVNYTVFGVGNSDWVSTFHRIPKLVDAAMEEKGATRAFEAGFTNVKEDLVGPWEIWSEGLWKTLRSAHGSKGPVETKALSVTIESSKTAKTLGGDEMNFGTVIANYELADTEVGPAKRHIDVRLPQDTQYTAGDYLVVQPKNPSDIISRVLRVFNIAEDDMISVAGSRKKFMPTKPISLHRFLTDAVELSTPITKTQISTLISYAKPEQKKALETLLDPEKYSELLSKRYSIIDTLEEFPSALPFSVYIDMLQHLSPRQYSISSSALAPINNPSNKAYADIASITFDVFQAPAWSGHSIFQGVASTYLASRQPGDRISCFIRSTNIGFRLPSNPITPVIMISAGTGIAPMRAFIQERAAILEAGVIKLGPAILFFGCRHEDKDFIYREELKEWEKKGAVEVKIACSRPDNGKKQYVQDLIWEEKERLAEMFRDGGKIYLCGSAEKLGRSAAEVCKKIHMEKSGCGEKEADEWLERQKEDRYISDVYG